MSNINLRYKNIFIHVPKTAGVSMESLPWNNTNTFFYKGHYTLKNFEDYGIDITKFFKWCFVRNPWDRLLSGYDYSDIIKKQFPTFDSLVRTIYQHRDNYSRLNIKWGRAHNRDIPNLLPNTPSIFFYNQVSLITIDNKIQMDFIGRFENLENDWKLLIEKLQKTGIKIPQPHYTLPLTNNRTHEDFFLYKKKPYMDYYTTETKIMVEEIYHQDIEAFKYKFGND